MNREESKRKGQEQMDDMIGSSTQSTTTDITMQNWLDGESSEKETEDDPEMVGKMKLRKSTCKEILAKHWMGMMMQTERQTRRMKEKQDVQIPQQNILRGPTKGVNPTISGEFVVFD